ncbi:MAG: hypothetical protein QXI16_03690 [Sulfolobaceae archaeon]
MKEVTKKEYRDFINPKNVSYSATGDHPYIGIWKDRNGNIVAKKIPEGKLLGISTDKYKYYIVSP